MPSRAVKPKPAPEPVEAEVEDDATEPDELEDEGAGPVKLLSRREDSKEPQYAEIFNIDGKSYGLDMARPAGTVVRALWVARQKQTAETMGLEFIRRVLGEEALDALLGYPDLDFQIIDRIVGKIMETVKGGAEPGKP